MPVVTARYKSQGKHFEIQVDLDEALKIKEDKGGDITQALQSNNVFYDLNKGTIVSREDLTKAFGTSELHEVAEKIIQKGEVQKTQEFRDAEREARIKRVIDLIIKNASDQHGRPYTEERIKRAIEEAHISIDKRPAEQQIPNIILALQKIIPIKLETKKIKLTIPAQYTGHVYGIINEYKESEEWLNNGSLKTILNIPSGMLLDFYDKLNHITHGAVHAEELPQK